MFFTLTLGDSYFPFLAYSCFPITGALLANAHAIIIAHNHPSGDVDPSNADKTFTTMLVDAGKRLLDVKVIDHVIIGSKGGFFSFSESCLM